MIDTLMERFLLKVEKTDTCWWWRGSARGPNGYGCMRIGGTTQAAHRIAYALWIGTIPKGMYVCHTCDNPSCVNPSHLFVGTHTDNMRDKVRKGRHKTGTLPKELRSEIIRQRWAKTSLSKRKKIGAKIADTQRGRVFNPEHLANLRAAHAARRGAERSIPWNKGVPMSNETRAKVSANRKGKGNGLASTPEAETERRRKLSEARKAYFARLREMD